MSKRRKVENKKTDTRCSLGDLSALLDDDESDGHRLAEFLLKKAGTKRPTRVFADFRPQRFSIDVRTEKVSANRNKDAKEDSMVSTSTTPPPKVGGPVSPMVPPSSSMLMTSSHQSPPGSPKAAPQSQLPAPQLSLPAPQLSLPAPQLSLPAPQSPLAAPQPPLIASQSPLAAPISPHRSPRSPNSRSSVKKSGGMPTADRLRRFTLKRLSTMSTSGRRTLLKDFENTLTDSNFLPPSSSTPMNQNNGGETAMFNDNVQIATPSHNNNPSEQSPNTESILLSLQRKDRELQNILENIVETTIHKVQEKENLSRSSLTPSPNRGRSQAPESTPTRRRTYTVEKGTCPGQVILTPSKSPTQIIANAETDVRNVTSTENNSKTNQCINSPSKYIASPKVMNVLQRIVGKSPQEVTKANSLKTKRSRIPLRTPGKSTDNNKVPVIEVPNTPENVVAENLNMSGVDNVEIPETQDVQNVKIENITHLNSETDKIIKTHSTANTPMIIIPIHQTFNHTPDIQTEIGQSNTILKQTKVDTNNETYHVSPIVVEDVNRLITAKPKTTEKSKQRNEIVNEDELRFSDIVTDDEDIPSTSAAPVQCERTTTFNCSNAPLNLAPPSEARNSTRTRRYRKRSSSKRQLELSHLLSTETEAEMGPPKAHALIVRRTLTRNRPQHRNVPLNAAPSTPINGERFAKELKSHLARLKNHEILDLRKRNSLGKVFPISGRKSVGKKQVSEKQLQLEEQIQLEILKRTLEGKNEGLNLNTCTEGKQTLNELNDKEVDTEMPLAPEGFRDHANNIIQHGSVPPSQIVVEGGGKPLKDVYSSSLIDERSCDRISFTVPKNLSSSEKKRRSRRNPKSMPEVLQKYLEATERVNSRNSLRKSRRTLYSEVTCSDETTDNSSFEQVKNSKEDVKTKTANESAVVSGHVDNVASEPSCNSHLNNITMNSTRRSTRVNIVPEPVNNTVISTSLNLPVNTSPNKSVRRSSRISTNLVPPPEPFSDNDHVNVSNASMNVDSVTGTTAIFKKPLLPVKKSKTKTNRGKITDDSRMEESLSASKPQSSENSIVEPVSGTSNAKTTDVFKESQLPANQSKTKKPSRKKVSEKTIEVESTPSTPQSNVDDTYDSNDETSNLRRSKRGHKPLRNYWSFRTTDPTPLYDVAILYRRKEESKKIREEKKKQIETMHDNTNASMPIASSTIINNNKNRNRKNSVSQCVVPNVVSSDNKKHSGKSRKQLSVIVEPETVMEDRSNMFHALDEVDISVATLHKVARTPKRNSETDVKKIGTTTSLKKTKKSNSKKDSCEKNTETDTEIVTTTKVKKKSNSPKPKNKTTVKKKLNSSKIKTSKNSNKITVTDMNKSISNGIKDVSNIRIEPSHVEHINNIFDTLKNAEVYETEPKKSGPKVPDTVSSKKKLRVRLPRISKTTKLSATGSIAFKSSSSSSKKQIESEESVNKQTSQTISIDEARDAEVLSWLKDISHIGSKIGTDENCEKPGKLVFENLHGIDYAFYEHVDNSSVGYIRMKPQQVKTTKRARDFLLQFVVLSGEFIICKNQKEETYKAGDLAIVPIGSRYSIKNVTEKLGILMVIKKSGNENV